VKLGIFLPNWIGDVVMATPALRALRKHVGPQARIVGIMRPYVADVLVGTPWLDDRIYFDPRSKNPELRGWRFARALRRERFDTVVLLTNSLRTAFWARMSGARQRVGYARDGRAMFLTHKLYAPMAGGDYAQQPTLDAYLRIAYALGCPRESTRMELATLPADEQAADEVWRRLEIPADKPVVVVNSGAAFGASKLWPAAHFGRLARRIADEWGYPVVAICGPREREIARQIVAEASHPGVMSLADPRLGEDFPLPIGLSKACVRRAALLVTTDSGPRHFAPAFDVPVVTLFGPTFISLSETHFAKAIHLQRKVPCGPCMEKICPLGHHQCMRDLSVDEVYAAVQSQLVAASEGQKPRGPYESWQDDAYTSGGGPLVIPAEPWHTRSGGATVLATPTTGAQRTALAEPPLVAALRYFDGPDRSHDRIANLPLRVPATAAGTAQIWINERFRPALAEAELDEFTAVMAATSGRLMRALPDRENWWLHLGGRHATGRGMFMKKHHVRTIGSWLTAKLGRATPRSPGRIEAENAARLEADGIRCMPVVAFGEKLHTSGLLESFILTDELAGYTQLDHFLRRRFAPLNTPACGGQRRDRDFDRLLARVAAVTGRFHRLGYNHRDLYCCHFFIREDAATNDTSGNDGVRLIDLQRVEQRTRWRRRWIVKDLAQLAYSAPRAQVSRSRRLAFFKAYLGVAKLQPADRRLLRSMLQKQWLMEFKLGPSQ